MVGRCWQSSSSVQVHIQVPVVITSGSADDKLFTPTFVKMDYSGVEPHQGQGQGQYGTNPPANLQQFQLVPQQHGPGPGPGAAGAPPPGYHLQSVPVAASAIQRPAPKLGRNGSTNDSEMAVGVALNPQVQYDPQQVPPMAIITSEPGAGHQMCLSEGGSVSSVVLAHGALPSPAVHHQPIPAPFNGQASADGHATHQYTAGSNGGGRARWSPRGGADVTEFPGQDGGSLQQHHAAHRGSPHQSAGMFPPSSAAASAGAGSPSSSVRQRVGSVHSGGTSPGRHSAVQNGHTQTVFPHMAIAQPNACISFPAQTIPVNHVQARNGFHHQPAYLNPTTMPPHGQSVTLATLAVPHPFMNPTSMTSLQDMRSEQQLSAARRHQPPPPHSGGNGLPTPTIADHATTACSPANGATNDGPNGAHSTPHDGRRSNGGGFSFEDIHSLWTPCAMKNVSSGCHSSTSLTPSDSSSTRMRMAASPGDMPTSPRLNQYKFPFQKKNPPSREFPKKDDGQLTITVKAGHEEEEQLSRMCSVHPRTRDIRIRRLERLPSHRRHFRCETCTDILQEFVTENGLYPNDDQKTDLLKKVGMPRSALNYWFSNRRRASPVGMGGQVRSSQQDSPPSRTKSKRSDSK